MAKHVIDFNFQRTGKTGWHANFDHRPFNGLIGVIATRVDKLDWFEIKIKWIGEIEDLQLSGKTVSPNNGGGGRQDRKDRGVPY